MLLFVQIWPIYDVIRAPRCSLLLGITGSCCFRWRLPTSRVFRRCWTWLTCLAPADIVSVRAAWLVIRCCRYYWRRHITTPRLRAAMTQLSWGSKVVGLRVSAPPPRRRWLAAACQLAAVNCRQTLPSWLQCRSAVSWYCGVCRPSDRCLSLVDSQS